MGDIESAMYGTGNDDGGEEDEEDQGDVNEKKAGTTTAEYDPDDPATHEHDTLDDFDAADTKKKTKTKKVRQRLFIVCFHLPVKLTKNTDEESDEKWQVTWTESLIAKTDNVLQKSKYDVHWIGTVSPPGGAGTLTQEDKDYLDVCLSKMSCTAIYLDTIIKQAHYLGMCKQVLWPMFHNVDLLDLTTSGSGQRDLFFHRQATSDKEGDAAAGGISLPVSSLGAQASVSDWDQSRLQGWWEAYQQVNRAFAESVHTSLHRPTDTLWIHDYHLSLLPQYVHHLDLEKFGRRRTKMVMFLHIPFPTSQIFRELECGEQILEGMLHADVVGFHAFDHARHFLNAGKRILGLTYESLVGGLIGMRYNARLVLITISNVSIEAAKVDRALKLPSIDMDMRMLTQGRHPHRRVICGMDVAQRLSGVSSKLLAYERLLTDYPMWQNKVVLMQVVNIPSNRLVDELITVRELRFLVRRIQDTFGPHVIDYQELNGGELSMAKRLPYWRASEVFLSTPIREGLNLLPLEYVYTRHASSEDEDGQGRLRSQTTSAPCKAGVTIVSEFGACSSILNGALRVNPYDIQMVAISIDKALTMSLEEREGRVMRDIEFISTCPSSKWTKNVLRDLQEVTMAMKDAGERNGDDDEDDIIVNDGKEAKKNATSSKSNVAATLEALDSIGSFLQRESELQFSYVNLEAIRAAYLSTKRRVIVMDFNGTLVVKEPPGKYLKREILGTSGYKPPSSVLRALTKLAADPQNTVIVVSGDSQENVEAAIGNIPNLYIAASNGATFSLALQKNDKRRTWYSFDLGVDWEAVKQVSLPVLSKYTARTNGSFVKLTHSSIGWSNYSADPEWGAMQASHLVLEMQQALAKFDVRFVTLKGVVEVVPRRLNKGLIVKKILREVAARNGGEGVDFCICMGDDVSDEKMFASVYSFLSELNEDYSNVVPSPSIMLTPQEKEEEAQQQQQADHAQQQQQGSSSGCPGLIGGRNPLRRCNSKDALRQTRPGSEFLTEETPNLKLKPEVRHNPVYAFTIAVGKKPSHASYYVDDARDVAHVLAAMTGDRATSARACMSSGTGGGSSTGTAATRSMSWDMEETGGVEFFS
jgi:trehalose 6-phosphate synthase/phosphatase